MTAHTCRTFDPSCYRCDLGRDEEIASIAEDYFEAEIEASYVAAGLPAEAMNSIRLRYVSDVRKNPEAVRLLYEWAKSRDD